MRAGLYVSTDGRYAVAHDGYPARSDIGADASGYEGFIGGEWAAVLTRTDENLDWFKTKREAVAYLNEYARKRDRIDNPPARWPSLYPGHRTEPIGGYRDQLAEACRCVYPDKCFCPKPRTV